MKRLLKLSAIISLILLWSSSVFALPKLQLDISDSYYDNATETVTATGEDFTLYALLTGDAGLLNYTYYVSAAVTPQVSIGADLGYFTFNGATIDVTDDMVFGQPPVETNLDHDSGDLPPHSTFPTYFTEFAFTFNADDLVGAYNVQDTPGGFDPLSYEEGSPFSYYAAFDVDTAGMLPGYAIHFDLYKELVKSGDDVDTPLFAPFSHDAQSSPAPVPEPASMLLFGTGLLGFAGVGAGHHRKKKCKSNCYI